MEKVVKNSFCVIGKAGSTNDGENFIQNLWKESNSHFEEVAPLAKRDENGELVGVWGIMTDFSFSFKPWEDNFSKGLYLAGVECDEDAVAPKGWKKWIVPGFTYRKVKVDGPDTFVKAIQQMKAENVELVGAVQDYTDTKTGTNYMLFPIEWNDSKQKMIRGIKNRTNQVAVCGFQCEYCFMGEWCGGCRSACDMCSFATLSEDNMCENVKCSESKGFTSCSECDEMLACKKGFFATEDASTPKASLLFIKEHGQDKFTEIFSKAIPDGFQYTADLQVAGSMEAQLKLLEGLLEKYGQ